MNFGLHKELYKLIQVVKGISLMEAITFLSLDNLFQISYKWSHDLEFGTCDL